MLIILAVTIRHLEAILWTYYAVPGSPIFRVELHLNLNIGWIALWYLGFYVSCDLGSIKLKLDQIPRLCSYEHLVQSLLPINVL